jgi:hypothetical protein
MKKMTQKTAWILQQYGLGASIGELAQQAAITPHGVYRRLQYHGVALRETRCQGQIERPETIAKYLAGFPMQQLANENGITYWAMNSWLKRRGVQMRPIGRPSKTTPPPVVHRQVALAQSDGSLAGMVNADCFAGLCIHEADLWTLSHISSGLRVGVFLQAKNAMTAMKQLAVVADWTQASESLKHVFGKAKEIIEANGGRMSHE